MWLAAIPLTWLKQIYVYLVRHYTPLELLTKSEANIQLQNRDKSLFRLTLNRDLYGGKSFLQPNYCQFNTTIKKLSNSYLWSRLYYPTNYIRIFSSFYRPTLILGNTFIANKKVLITLVSTYEIFVIWQVITHQLNCHHAKALQ